MDVKVSLNEGALTLVNVGQPCLRIIFDLKAELKKKKTDWRLELGLGALQAFGLGGEGARATTLLTRRTWRPNEDAERAGTMIQIGEVVVMVVVVVVTLSLLLLLLLLLLLRCGSGAAADVGAAAAAVFAVVVVGVVGCCCCCCLRAGPLFALNGFTHAQGSCWCLSLERHVAALRW